MAEDDVTELKVMVGRIEERLKVLERAFYGMAGMIGLYVIGQVLTMAFRGD